MLNSCHCAFCLLLALLPLSGSAAPPPAGDFQVAGAVVKPADYSPDMLRKQFRSSLQTITYTRRGVHHTAHAVPLLTVVQAAQPRISPQIKNHALQFVVLVAGHDGYTAAFSFGELSPDFGRRAVWLAMDEDGRPLGDGAVGEVNLVVPEDAKAGRWVHSVERITVVDEVQAAGAGRP